MKDRLEISTSLELPDKATDSVQYLFDSRYSWIWTYTNSFMVKIVFFSKPLEIFRELPRIFEIGLGLLRLTTNLAALTNDPFVDKGYHNL